MILVTYTHTCDRCSIQFCENDFKYTHGSPMPLPTKGWYIGIDLCDDCETIVYAAIKESMVISESEGKTA